MKMRQALLEMQQVQQVQQVQLVMQREQLETRRARPEMRRVPLPLQLQQLPQHQKNHPNQKMCRYSTLLNFLEMKS